MSANQAADKQFFKYLFRKSIVMQAVYARSLSLSLSFTLRFINRQLN